jgi:hypothetical protein
LKTFRNEIIVKSNKSKRVVIMQSKLEKQGNKWTFRYYDDGKQKGSSKITA